MLFPKCLILCAFLVCQMATAEELSEILNTLRTNHQNLEGYQATYELNSNTGQTGNIEIGVDFRSGWSYLMSEFKNEEGKLIQKASNGQPLTASIFFSRVIKRLPLKD